jgi:hypothetical protein
MEKTFINCTFAPHNKILQKSMNKFFTIILAIAFILSGFESIAQNYRPSKRETALDFGIVIGGSNYMGELSREWHPALEETNLGGGIMCRFTVNEFLSLKGSALYMRISGDDKNYASEDLYRRMRNLNFRSDIVEFSGQIEINIPGWYQSPTSFAASPYLFAGLAVFRFNPKTQFFFNPSIHDASLSVHDGKWIELQPLSTEAQETTKNNEQKRYSLTQISIPFGIGYKFQLSDHWTMGFEFGLRKTFTDYLDDISTIYWDDQIVGGAGGYLSNALKDRAPEVGFEKFPENTARGNPSTKDWYMFGGLHITYRILGGKVQCFNFQ